MKIQSTISIVMTVRKNSKRCNNKLLRNFAGTTLFEIAMEKISKIKNYDIFVGAFEDEFKEIIEKYKNVNIIERSEESVNISGNETTGPRKLFEMYEKINHDWVFWINPCHAFLKLDTIKNAIKKFSEIKNKSMTSVVPLSAWYYKQDGTPLNNFSAKTGVSTDDYLYVGAHAFHAYERTMPLDSNKVWENVKGDPFIYPIDEEEAYDINTEEEFLVSEFLYKKTKKNREKNGNNFV